jgi:hypothetical protein
MVAADAMELMRLLSLVRWLMCSESKGRSDEMAGITRYAKLENPYLALDEEMFFCPSIERV